MTSKNTTSWHRAVASQGLLKNTIKSLQLIIRRQECLRLATFKTHYMTLKKREVMRFSSCFAIAVEPALKAGLENHQGTHPSSFAADVPKTSPFVNDNNLDTLEPQNAGMVADLAGIHQAADSAPGSCNMCWQGRQTLFENQAHAAT